MDYQSLNLKAHAVLRSGSIRSLRDGEANAFGQPTTREGEGPHAHLERNTNVRNAEASERAAYRKRVGALTALQAQP